MLFDLFFINLKNLWLFGLVNFMKKLFSCGCTPEEDDI